MALSVELLMRLNASEEPLPKRLRLAENILYTNDIPIVRKEDIILQWLCDTLSEDQTVWVALKNCLHINNLDIKITIKRKLLDIIIEKFQDNIKCIQNDIFECCSLLVANIGFQQYFISKPEDLGLLVKSLLECIYIQLKNILNNRDHSMKSKNILLINKNDDLMIRAYSTAVSVLDSIILIFKSASTTKEKLRTIFVNDILYPLCIIIGNDCSDNTNALKAIAHKCIQKLIFVRKNVQSEEFQKVDDDAMNFKNLLLILTEKVKRNSLEHNTMTFNFFFHVAISVFKSNSTVLDTMLRTLVECSDIYEKEILNTFLIHLIDVRFNFNNKRDNITMSDYCQNIINKILVSKDMSNIDCELLVQFCCLNPLIMEMRMQDILWKTFLNKSSVQYENLMNSILDVFVHLRQEEKLFSTIFISLRDCLQQTSLAKTEMFFPKEFKEKLIKVVNNVTHTQTVNILRTLIYHLKTDCLEMLQSNDTYQISIMLQGIVELLTVMLDGICIFKYNGRIVSYKKFITVFNDLKKILILLMQEILYLHHDAVGILLNAIYSWNETQRVLKYYMPKTVLEDLDPPILKETWQQLIQDVANFKNKNCTNYMNKLIVQEVKISPFLLNKSCVALNDLIDGLESYWQSILKFDTEIISSMNNEQISKLTNLLLEDMMSNVNICNQWVQVLQKDELQENKRFMIYVLHAILTQISHLTLESITRYICTYFNAELLFEIESLENKQINNILAYIKDGMLVTNKIRAEDKLLCQIEVNLGILHHLPLKFLNPNIRLIIFVVIFALKLECEHSKEVVSLCNTIFSDLLERSNIDVFQYINPILLLQQVPHNRIFQKALELFIKNCSYVTLKNLIESCINSNKSMYFLLESMEHIKPKLSVNQKTIIKKAQQKLTNTIIKTLSGKILEADNVKMLNLVLRISIANGNITEKLRVMTESTVQHMLRDTNESLKDDLQLMVVILHNKRLFQITNETLKEIWHASFQHPYEDVLLPLLQSCEPKELAEFLDQLHNEMVKIISSVHENDVVNIYVIWNAILKTNMSNDRNRFRLLAINNLIQIIQISNIPETQWPHLLKLIKSIIITKHLYLPGYIVDMILFVGLKSLEKNTLLNCSDTLMICSALLKFRTSLITDRLPSLLVLYRRIFTIIVHKSKIIVNNSEEYAFKCLAIDIERFTSSLIKLKKDMIRISPYLIADLMELFSNNLTANFVKVSLQNCMYLLISICDQHGIAFLSRTLPIPIQEIFKTQLDMYNKFYKFGGKI